MSLSNFFGVAGVAAGGAVGDAEGSRKTECCAGGDVVCAARYLGSVLDASVFSWGKSKVASVNRIYST